MNTTAQVAEPKGIRVKLEIEMTIGELEEIVDDIHRGQERIITQRFRRQLHDVARDVRKQFFSDAEPEE